MNPGWVITAADPDATLKDYGPRYCGPESHVATGNSDEISRILSRLRQLGGHWTIEKNQCHRLGCGQDAGVYWCNVSCLRRLMKEYDEKRLLTRLAEQRLEHPDLCRRPPHQRQPHPRRVLSPQRRQPLLGRSHLRRRVLPRRPQRGGLFPCYCGLGKLRGPWQHCPHGLLLPGQAW